MIDRTSHLAQTASPLRRMNRLRKRAISRWLTIGLGVKRWLAVLLIGITILGLGLAYLLIDYYRDAPLPGIFYFITLQFLPRALRGVLFGGLGLLLFGLGLFKLSRWLIEPFAGGRRVPVADAVYQYRQRERGPKIVAIGGGTGLSTFLRGIKDRTSNITAIVTVADDGGSSGKLRRELGILPPGDFRQCIAALADDEALTTHLFQYRFSGSADDGAGLSGHAFGNLFIAAMTNVVGSFEQGLAESSRVLAVRGRILPSTVTPLTLIAELQDDSTGKIARAQGESVITHAGASIRRLSILPEDARAYPDAIRAILDADAIILAPGSLYTSLLPNLLVRGVTDAIRAARGVRLYICNVATQIGETTDYSVSDHIAAIERHVGQGLLDAVIANSRHDVDWVGTPRGVGEMIRFAPGESVDPRIIGRDVVNVSAPWRHDSQKLAEAVTAIVLKTRTQSRKW